MLFSSVEHAEDSFDQQIASALDALDNLQLEQSVYPSSKNTVNRDRLNTSENVTAVIDTKPGSPFCMDGHNETLVTENSEVFQLSNDYTSCEDLLDFTGNGTQNEKKNNKEKGTHSDEVRIMEKVLGPKVKIKFHSQDEQNI